MKAYEVRSEDGLRFLLETDDTHVDILVPATADGELAGIADTAEKMAAQLLDSMGRTIGSTCRTLYEQARERMGEYPPSEFSLEFGLKCVGELGLWTITKASLEGAVKVTATWTSPKDKQGD